MSGLEVVAVVAAVVSAFHGAAELTAAIKARRQGKRSRKDKERDMEQAIQERNLHASLVQGAEQIDATGIERSQKFGYAFEKGDSTATSELKDVVIRLQGEVIRALQIAKKAEDAILNLQILQDASISRRLEALRSMDGLCYRIEIAQMTVPRSLDLEPELQRLMSHEPYVAANLLALPRRGSRESIASFQTTHMALPPAVSILSTSGGPSAGRSHQLLGPPTQALQRGGSISSLAPSFAWMASRIQRSDNDNATLRSFNMADNTRPHSRVGNLDGELAQALNGLSVRHPSSLAPNLRQQASQPYGRVDEMISSRHESAGRPHRTNNDRNDGDAMIAAGSRHREILDFDASPMSSPSITLRTHASGSTLHSFDRPARSDSAPAIPTQDTLSMLPDRDVIPELRLRPAMSTPSGPSSSSGSRSSVEHLMWSPEQDEVWSPLSEPTAHNKYHGFCKGAWQTRMALEQGLRITLVPHGGQEIPHWQCTDCAFRSRAPNDSRMLTEQIYFAPSGVRYRWLFLAKSHVPTEVSHAKPSDYSYACIICAAQSGTKSAHWNLDALMAHIAAKHKPSMLTPQVKHRTKCIVTAGKEVADEAEDWDVNICGARSKSAASGMIITALTGVGSETLRNQSYLT